MANQTFEKAESHAGSNLGDLPVWDLSDLYRSMSAPEVAADIKALGARVKALKADYEGRLADLAASPQGGDKIADLLTRYEDLQDLMGRLWSYAGLLFYKNSKAPGVAKFYGDLSGRLTEIQSELLFVGLELNDLEADVVNRLYAHPELRRLKPWIENNRIFKPYQLHPETERLLAEKSVTGRQAWVRLFDETLSGLKAEFRGEEKTFSEIYSMMSEPDASVRKDAARVVSAVLAENAEFFARITNVLAKDLAIEAKARRYPDMATARHLSNQIEAPIVETLLGSVKSAYPSLAHRYYKLKARWFGVEQLDFWDRAAPLPQDDDAKIGWNQAKDIVLSAYEKFSPEMRDLAAPFFEKGWIDAPVVAGKASGAFSHPTVPSAHPYILVNYLGRTRDVMTLAHELGHGVHQVLAAKQGPLLADTPLTLAETASVFGEMLTFQSLKEEAATPQSKKVLIASKVEDMLNTVVRQICFYDFERRLHGARRNGELTVEEIGEIWMSVQRDCLGPSIRLEGGYENYWSSIPHFIHTPFYVYAYAFGDCLVNSLFAVYQEDPDSFRGKYFDMLGAGGSLRHKELLAPFGLDASDPEFWNRGLSMIASLIDELETLEDV